MIILWYQSHRQMGDEQPAVVCICHLNFSMDLIWACSGDVGLYLRRWNRLTVRNMSADTVNPVEMMSGLFAPFISTWKGSGMRRSEMVWRQQRWGLTINIGDHDWRILRTLSFLWVSCCESCVAHTLFDFLSHCFFVSERVSVWYPLVHAWAVRLRLWCIYQATATENSGHEDCQQGRGCKEAWNSSIWDPWLVWGVRTCCGDWFRTKRD